MNKNWTMPRIKEFYAILYKCIVISIYYLHLKLFENNVLYRKTYFCGKILLKIGEDIHS